MMHGRLRDRPAGGHAGMRRVALVVMTLPLLAACAVGPDYKAPALNLPARWGDARPSKPAKAPDLAQWWRRLNDPTLNTLIDQAVAGNLDAASAKAKIREARATRRQAAAGLFPSVDGSTSVARTKDASGTTTSGDTGTSASSSPYTLYQAGFDATWELDLFGANRRTLEAADRGVEAADDELRSTLLTLLGDVAENYVEARGYQARIELARRTATSQRATAALTRQKFEAGSASAMDTAKAKALADSTEADIPTLETSYMAAVHRLGVLLGREPAALARSLRRRAPIPAPRLPIATGIPADVLRNRPDVRKAERQLAQATASIGTAEAALYPSVSLTGDISTSALKTGDLGKSATIGWSFGPSVSMPIFNAGKLQAAVEVSQAGRDQYYVAFRSAVLTALEDVENAIVSLHQERIKVQRLGNAAQSYREAARLSHALYQTGTSSFLDVLDAERSLYSAEDSLLQSRVAIATDYVALNKALGGGWNGAIDSSKREIVDTNTGPHIVGAVPPRAAEAND